MKIKAVIGANYGDEGKGLMTYYLSKAAEGRVLNVLHNGGAQRGHTVETKEGLRYVHHHLGCGTLIGADTYFDKHFMVNPLVFNQEVAEMSQKYGKRPKIYIHPDCRVTTPYDMLLNQMVEESRAKKKHGSCGMGVFETVKRYEDTRYNKTFTEMSRMTSLQLVLYLDTIVKEYMPKKVEEYGIPQKIVDKYLPIILARSLLYDFVSDFFTMTTRVTECSIASGYDTIIFEGAQGLALDKDGIGFPHLTPSNTGLTNVIDTIEREKMGGDLDVWYVTRSYFTRHGAGELPTECSKEKINSGIEDKTNVPNPYQDLIRYGEMDVNSLLSRIDKDWCLIPAGARAARNLAVTHCNYKELTEQEKKRIRPCFKDVLYIDKKWVE